MEGFFYELVCAKIRLSLTASNKFIYWIMPKFLDATKRKIFQHSLGFGKPIRQIKMHCALFRVYRTIRIIIIGVLTLKHF